MYNIMHLSQHDLFTGLTAIAVIAVALLIIELAVKNKWLNKLLARKLLHCSAIGTCAWAIHSFENRIFLACVFLLFFFILLAIIRKGWMQVNEYRTYGIAFFPLSFAVLLFIPAFPGFIIVYAVLILGFSDALAGICGEYFGKQKITFLFENKSVIGFVAFYISAFIISIFYFNSFSFHSILLGAALSLLPAITELFSYRGSDNFTVPVFTATWALLILYFDDRQLLTLFLSVALFTALSIFAVYKKWLTVSGAVAACWVALLLYVTGGYKAFVAPGIFLISGSLLSKLNKPQKEKEGRNAIQVFANGIIGVVFMILFGITQQNIYLITAIISFCISMADSSSSELGVYFKRPTYDILSFKKLPVGVSGGVSLAGTLAGLAGAVLIAAVALYCYHFSFTTSIWIAVAGFTGMLTDSILGSWLQLKYRTSDGIVSDDPITGAKKLKGFTWCTNDAVNIISNLVITLLFFFIFK
ncbi:DUF92 domain-containing protein [Ferruginibacter sp. SUN106]|uniref:DUF92 domain-containing protein n=1 Tax=Ferruginibacter sp. SUN106 TaxID=2978348 RepID=UPI003D3662FA